MKSDKVKSSWPKIVQRSQIEKEISSLVKTKDQIIPRQETHIFSFSQVPIRARVLPLPDLGSLDLSCFCEHHDWNGQVEETVFK